MLSVNKPVIRYPPRSGKKYITIYIYDNMPICSSKYYPYLAFPVESLMLYGVIIKTTTNVWVLVPLSRFMNILGVATFTVSGVKHIYDTLTCCFSWCPGKEN